MRAVILNFARDAKNLQENTYGKDLLRTCPRTSTWVFLHIAIVTVEISLIFRGQTHAKDANKWYGNA